MRVLVVDDQVELAAVVAGALEDRGFEVRVAHAGREALAEIELGRPDAAVVDLLLPDMLGTQVLDALARERPPVPSVAVSGVFHGERYRREAMDAHGALRFLEKPFSTRALVDVVSELMGVASLDEAELEDVLDEPLFPGEPLPPPTDRWPRPVEADPRARPAPRPTLPDEGDAGDGEADPVVAAALDALTDAAEPEPVEVARPAPAGPSDPDEGFDPRLLAEEVVPAPSAEASARARRMGIVEDLVDGGPTGGRAAPRSPVRPGGDERGDAGPSPDVPGPLGPLVLPRLLTACRRRGLGGRLELVRSGGVRRIHLDRGEVVFASSNLPEDRLLAFAVREGRLADGDAREVEERMREGRRVGEAILSLGLVDRAGLRRMAADHAAAIVRAALSWTEGSYRLVEETPRTRVVDHGLPRLLRAGLKEAPADVVTGALPDDLRPRPHPDPAFDPAEPEVVGEAADLLAAADGTKTVADLLALSDLPEREARARLAAWVGLEVLTLGPAPAGRAVAFVL